VWTKKTWNFSYFLQGHFIISCGETSYLIGGSTTKHAKMKSICFMLFFCNDTLNVNSPMNFNLLLSFLGDSGKPIVNTSYNPWSPWSPCPQTCNNGNNSAVQVRNRTCYTYVSPDLGCGNLGSITMETRPCGVQICPGIICSAPFYGIICWLLSAKQRCGTRLVNMSDFWIRASTIWWFWPQTNGERDGTTYFITISAIKHVT